MKVVGEDDLPEIKSLRRRKHKTLQMGLREQRRRIAAKVKNPRLLKVTFVTLRHFKATMEYHRTKDILHVISKAKVSLDGGVFVQKNVVGAGCGI